MRTLIVVGIGGNVPDEGIVCVRWILLRRVVAVESRRLGVSCSIGRCKLRCFCGWVELAYLMSRSTAQLAGWRIFGTLGSIIPTHCRSINSIMLEHCMGSLWYALNSRICSITENILVYRFDCCWQEGRTGSRRCCAQCTYPRVCDQALAARVSATSSSRHLWHG